MNDSAVSICVLKDILIDPDFESVCHREHLRQLSVSARGIEAEVYRTDHDEQIPGALGRRY